MAGFSFYAPNIGTQEIEALSAELRIPNVELNEAFLEESSQAMFCASFESGLRYVCIRLNNPLADYSKKELQQVALWCEANYVEAMLFTSPGESAEEATNVLTLLDDFRVDVVFENRNGTFLSTPDEMAVFFRDNRNALLCFNGAEMVSQRIHPFLTALNGRTYRRQLFMVQAQDRCFNGEDVLPGHGDAELAETFSAAAGFSRNVWASVTPYAGFSLSEIKSNMSKILCRI